MGSDFHFDFFKKEREDNIVSGNSYRRPLPGEEKVKGFAILDSFAAGYEIPFP